MSKTKLILFTTVALLIPFYNSLAQQLEKIPGQTSVGDSDLIGYLNNLYKFGISITGILAIFMIGVGAFAYIVTSVGNTSKMMDAKEKITNALIGLVIALTAYLFLYVINPDLVGGTLEGPSEIIGDITSDETSSYEKYSDGTLCDDGSESPTCTDCPRCSNCESCDTYSDSTFDCYWRNSEDVHVCGVDPEITAVKTADPDAIGCCEYDLIASFGKSCETGMTKSVCESKTGGNIFYLGDNYNCVDAPGVGSGDECVLEE